MPQKTWKVAKYNIKVAKLATLVLTTFSVWFESVPLWLEGQDLPYSRFRLDNHTQSLSDVVVAPKPTTTDSF